MKDALYPTKSKKNRTEVEKERSEKRVARERERQERLAQQEKERAEKQVQREKERAEKKAQREKERAEKKAQREKERAEKQVQRQKIKNKNEEIVFGEKSQSNFNYLNQPVSHDTKPTDYVFQKMQQDINLTSRSLQKLAEQIDYQDTLIPTLTSLEKGKKNKNIEIEVVLLTAKKPRPQQAAFFEWLGISPTEPLFEGPQSIRHRQGLQNISFNIAHFDDKPLFEHNHSSLIKILVFDQEFAEQHNLEQILKTKAIDVPFAFLVSLEAEDKRLHQLKGGMSVNCYGVKTYTIDQLPKETFIAEIYQEKYQKKIEYIRLFKELKELIKIGRIINHGINNQQITLENDDILTEKQKVQYVAKKSELTTKDLNLIKTDIVRDFKTIVKHIEQDIEKIELEDDEALLKTLKNKVEGLTNIKEIEGSKQSTLAIPDGFLEDLKRQVYRKMANFFEENKSTVYQEIKEVQSHTKEQLITLGVTPSSYSVETMNKQVTDDILKQNLTYTKTYEKQITVKGLYHLMMEIRTPLFMIMPLMMVGGIFVVLAQQDDLGSISKSEDIRNGQPCVSITQLPVKYKNSDEFIKRLSDPIILKATGGRSRGVTFHDKDGNCHLKLKEVAVKNAKRRKTVLDYEKEESTGKIYLFLSESGNRDWVIEQLKDSKNKLLTLPADGGSSMGLQVIIRILGKAGPYKPLILVAIVGLMWWYMKKKQREFDKEKMEIRNREIKNLKTNLKQEVEKMVRSSSSRWRSKMIDYLSEQQSRLQLTVDTDLHATIAKRNQRINEKINVIDLRFGVLKNKHKQIINYKKELQKQIDTLHKIKTKFRKELAA